MKIIGALNHHKYRPNRIVRTAPRKRVETVVVWPDGTIERGRLAKFRQRVDECVLKIAEKIGFTELLKDLVRID